MKHKKLVNNIIKKTKWSTTEYDKIIHKSLIIHYKSKLQLQLPHQSKLQNKRLCHKKIKNLCILTGHSKNILKRYKITRFALKQLHKQRVLPGIINTTW